MVPAARTKDLNGAPVDGGGRFVLYWMIAARRTRSNFALQRAVELARELRVPVLVFEPLRCGYADASDRIHRFVMQGMAANARACEGRVAYFPFVERAAGEGRGLLRALSSQACAVVTDEWPAYFVPARVAAAAAQVRVRLEAVDSNGLIPLSAHEREFPTARGYRAFVQRALKTHLKSLPDDDPLTAAADLPRLGTMPPLEPRWSPATPAFLADARSLDSLPIDHSVGAVDVEGGAAAAARTLDAFVGTRLDAYADSHNHPDDNGTSRLSPYLHFGHVSAHEVFGAVMSHERWTTRRLSPRGGGAREGWWGVSPSAENFLDQIVVWRELAFNGCAWSRASGYDAVPAWARQTLQAHLEDPRPHLYDEETIERAATADRVWNAAQRQMVRDGWFHGYMRMVWGKKILEWTAEPAQALEMMERLMNRYSLDGRDPVSYASYGWVLGRYDRPWFERPIFGTVRYMTTQSAARKLRMKAWLARYDRDEDEPSLFS